MHDPENAERTAHPEEPGSEPDGVGDALRAAVERTLAVTADSATETRQRAQNLLDDVVRRGQVARDQVAKRGEEATTRLAEAISDLRAQEGEEVAELRRRVGALESRLAAIENGPTANPNPLVENEVSAAEADDQRNSEG